MSCVRLANLFNEFSLDWEADLEDLLTRHPEWKDSLVSVVAIKNQVAHGHGGSVGFLSAKQYAGDVIRFVKALDPLIT